ncbi:hypothetical protein AB0N88_30080 [Streptomyces sp. NPDC093516]|uniref:hypothetical protein n=1 Tax=Streptomyces sp. NPDC093516 TaxID=3155304 RepID=UPI00344AB9AF
MTEMKSPVFRMGIQVVRREFRVWILCAAAAKWAGGSSSTPAERKGACGDNQTQVPR